MKRRGLIRTLAFRQTSRKNEAENYGFSSYAGPWTFDHAAHLLRRTTFGPNRSAIEWSVRNGLSATVNRLFQTLPLPAPPKNSEHKNDPDVPIGATWINSKYRRTNFNDIRNYRARSLRSWYFNLLLEEGISIREKLTLFWHNHFPTDSNHDPKFLYRNLRTLREHAWGSFRDLTKAITIDPAMLMYLDGDQNRRVRPNENYARELLELFTVGKGPLIAPGDYSNYTEQDIRAIARVLTGWEVYGYLRESTDGKFGSRFSSKPHDTGDKVLSRHFDNEVISNRGNKEYAYLIDVIFRKEEVSRFICRKLYRWFVFHKIDERVEDSIITPMAQVLRQNDYRIKPALMALLSSGHFFDPSLRACMFKSPIDLIMSGLKSLEVPVSTPLAERYRSTYALFGLARKQQQEIFRIPEVAGWRAYYLKPVYYRYWISATTLLERKPFLEDLAGTGVKAFQDKAMRMRIRGLDLIQGLDNPMDPNDLIEELAQVILPVALNAAQLSALKEVLIPGLPDFEWTIEYGHYLDNPGNEEVANAVERKVAALVGAMLAMPEFQLS